MKTCVAALLTAATLVTAGCSADGNGPEASGTASPTPSASPSPSAPPEPFTFRITPAAKAKDLPISTEIGMEITGGRATGVTLADGRGGQVAGRMRDDGTSWVPDRPLKFGRTYTATATAAGDDGSTLSRTTVFSTMRGRAGRREGTGLYLFDDRTYGVAMPVVVEFIPGIKSEDRGGVQRRLFVTTDPPQPGVWHWVSSGTQAYYRGPDYWQPGTKITVRIALDGHPVGGGRWGDVDRRASVTIGRKLSMDVDNKTKSMSVYENDRLVRTMPVSLGKRSTPSSSGTMVIMDKKTQTIFDTFAELGPSQGYRLTIAYAQRLTWGGQYIHSAPWSVSAQGHRNVSHGCVNLSPANARWLFGRTLVGDPITVRGTERKLEQGDGWTPWNLSWSRYIEGSALPVSPELAQAAAARIPSATASSSPTPSAWRE